MICRIELSRPPGVSIRITSEGRARGVGPVDRLDDVGGGDRVDDAVELDHRDVGPGGDAGSEEKGREGGRQPPGGHGTTLGSAPAGVNGTRSCPPEGAGDKIARKHMFGTLGGPELFLIFVVALIVFGPRKLPEIGKSLGKMMGEFRRASNEFRSTIENEVEAEKIRESMRIEPPRVEPVTPPPAGAGEPTPATPARRPAVPTTRRRPGGRRRAAEPPPRARPVPETVSRQPATPRSSRSRPAGAPWRVPIPTR